VPDRAAQVLTQLCATPDRCPVSARDSQRPHWSSGSRFSGNLRQDRIRGRPWTGSRRRKGGVGNATDSPSVVPGSKTDLADQSGDPFSYEVRDIVCTPFPQLSPDAHVGHPAARSRKDRGQGLKTHGPTQGRAVTSRAATSMTSAWPNSSSRFPGACGAPRLRPHGAGSPDTSGSSPWTDALLNASTKAYHQRVVRNASCPVSAQVPWRRGLFNVVDRHVQVPR